MWWKENLSPLDLLPLARPSIYPEATVDNRDRSGVPEESPQPSYSPSDAPHVFPRPLSPFPSFGCSASISDSEVIACSSRFEANEQDIDHRKA